MVVKELRWVELEVRDEKGDEKGKVADNKKREDCIENKVRGSIIFMGGVRVAKTRGVGANRIQYRNRNVGMCASHDDISFMLETLSIAAEREVTLSQGCPRALVDGGLIKINVLIRE